MSNYSITTSDFQRFLLIACEVLQREFFYCAAKSTSVIDIEFCSQGYHDLESTEMCKRIQEKVDYYDDKGYDAILIGFALCSNGILGLKAGKTPLVIPRAHDCITLLLGSKEKYMEYFSENPGTYYLSSGWIERDAKNLEDLRSISLTSKFGINKSYAELLKEYGEDNAKYIFETLNSSLSANYSALTFINTNLGNINTYRQITAEEAKKRSLQYKEITGNLSLLQKLLDAKWDNKDFLVLKTGQKIVRGDDNTIIAST